MKAKLEWLWLWRWAAWAAWAVWLALWPAGAVLVPAEGNGKSVYMMVIANGTPTYAGEDHLNINLTVLQD